MLRESHRALMHNDTALRSELKDLHQRYRADAKHWKKNFRDLQQYYQGLASAPPPDTANVSMWPPTTARHDDDLAEDTAVLQERAMAAAWGPSVMEDAEEALARAAAVGSSFGTGSSSSNISRGSRARAKLSGPSGDRGGASPGAPETSDVGMGAIAIPSGDRGVAEVGELDLTASTFRKRSTGRENGDSGRSTKEAVGSLSPVARARGGAGKTTGAKKYPNSPSPIRRRALGELAEDEIREKLQWTHAMSSAKRTIESKR